MIARNSNVSVCLLLLAICGFTMAGVPTSVPTSIPTSVPTSIPTSIPTAVPTMVPTALPTVTFIPGFVTIYTSPEENCQGTPQFTVFTLGQCFSVEEDEGVSSIKFSNYYPENDGLFSVRESSYSDTDCADIVEYSQFTVDPTTCDSEHDSFAYSSAFPEIPAGAYITSFYPSTGACATGDQANGITTVVEPIGVCFENFDDNGNSTGFRKYTGCSSTTTDYQQYSDSDCTIPVGGPTTYTFSTCHPTNGMYFSSFCTFTATPTVMPTVVPSAAPTVVPTWVPTAAPTVEPTAAPTWVPTAAPTVVPNVDPSVAPTVAPTAVPTVVPTVMPTVVPNTDPTLAPSPVPTVVPTKAPTRKPSVTPTAAPTKAPSITPYPTFAPTQVTSTTVSFSSNLTIAGSASSTVDSNGQLALRNATAQSMGVNINNVAFLGAVPSGSRRRLQSGVTLIASVQTTVSLAELGYSDPTAMYNALVGSLNAAVTGGSFTSSLQAASLALGDDTFASASATGVSNSAAEIQTAPTTPTDNGGKHHHRLNDGEIAGVVIGCTVGGFLILAAIYYFVTQSGGEGREKSAADRTQKDVNTLL